MNFNVSPDDLTRVAGTVLSREPDPVALAGRLLGMSGAEARAGAPPWAWAAGAFVAGVGLGALLVREYGGRK